MLARSFSVGSSRRSARNASCVCITCISGQEGRHRACQPRLRSWPCVRIGAVGGGGGRRKQDTLVVGRARQGTVSHSSPQPLSAPSVCAIDTIGVLGRVGRGCAGTTIGLEPCFLGPFFSSPGRSGKFGLHFLAWNSSRTCEAPAVPRMRMWMAGREDGRYNRGLT